MTLEGVKWGRFIIGELFELVSGRCSNAGNLEHDDMGVPYVGATNRNNGVLDFVKPIDRLMMKGNCIAFVKQGEGSVGYSVYKHEDFIASTSVSAGYAPFINKYTGIFITTVADQVRGKYNYNYPRSDSRLRQEVIQLPVDESGQPDYAFMERFIHAHEQRLIRAYVEHISERVKDSEEVTLDGVRWGKFAIGDLFRIEQGKCSRANELMRSHPKIPYLGATNRNNGVLDFVDIDEKLMQKGNCIAFIKDGEGAMGYAVYKAEDFIATTNMALGYAPFLDRYIGMFITTVADKVRGKYSYNYKRNEERLKKEVIQLPTTQDGLPDWHLMHSYMLAHESRLLSAVISHFTAKLHT